MLRPSLVRQFKSASSGSLSQPHGPKALNQSPSNATRLGLPPRPIVGNWGSCLSFGHRGCQGTVGRPIITANQRISHDNPQRLIKLMNWLLPLLPFVLFFAWLFLFGMRHGKSCPDCGHPLPSFQSPLTKTKRQWVEGGFLCYHCGCESDIFGNKVASGISPTIRSICLRIALVALAAVPAVAMLVLLFQM